MNEKTFVLAVGVNAYPHLTGSPDLKGAVRDARTMLAFGRGTLQVDPEHCTLLTSPRVQAKDVGLPEANVGIATKDAFTMALGALREFLREDDKRTAVISFSGHGACEPDQKSFIEGARMALAFSDATRSPQGLDGVVTMAEIELALGALSTRVTIVVDACYSSLQHEVLIGAPPAEDKVVPRSRLLLGAGLWDTAYESQIDGAWRGVFTFCLVTALTQWRTDTHAGVRFVRGSYQEVLFRTRSIMQALGYDGQQAQLSGGLYAPMLPFNFPDADAGPEDITFVPDGNRRGKEIGSGSDHPGVITMELQQTGHNSWYSVLGPVAGSKPNANHGVTVTYQQGHSTPVEAATVQYFCSDQLADKLSQVAKMKLAPSAATSQNQAYTLDLTGWSGTVTPQGQAFSQTENAWHTDTNGPSFNGNYVFGPYTFDVYDNQGHSQNQQAQVYIEIAMNGTTLHKVKYWSTSQVDGYLALGWSSSSQTRDRVIQAPSNPPDPWYKAVDEIN